MSARYTDGFVDKKDDYEGIYTGENQPVYGWLYLEENKEVSLPVKTNQHGRAPIPVKTDRYTTAFIDMEERHIKLCWQSNYSTNVLIHKGFKKI